MAYLQKSTSAGFDYGGFFKQELAKQHAKTQQALVPQTASGSGCNLDDARTGDAAWKCVCRATDFGMSELPGADGAMPDSEVMRASARLLNLLSQRGLDALCSNGDAYNPYGVDAADATRGTCSRHSPIYELFPPRIGVPLPDVPKANGAELTQEWLGNYREWFWDCLPTSYKMPYVAYSPMRLVDCVRGVPAKGAALPVVDEEYFEMADGLLAVASAPIGGKFVVAEVGARYAPWALRSMVAARHFGRSKEVYGIVVDPIKMHVDWVRRHFELNGFGPNQYRLEKKRAFRGDPLWGGKAKNATFREEHVIRLAEILEGVDHVDLLDVDVQGSEKYILRTIPDKKALEQKVMRIHVETHTVEIGKIVTKLLVKHGFRIVRNASSAMNWGYRHASIGNVGFRSGYVFASNTRFENTLNGTC